MIETLIIKVNICKYIEFGKYLGCRFEKDNFNDYMKCIKYRSWDSAEYSNFALSFFSGKWYEKYHDIPHD